MNNLAIISTFIEEAFHKGNLSILEHVIHPDYHYISPDSELRRIDQLEAFIQEIRTALPDLRLDICDQIETGNRACIRVQLTGTHEADFMGLPATGKKVDVFGIIMTRFKDGKIIEGWELLDQLSLQQQLI